MKNKSIQIRILIRYSAEKTWVRNRQAVLRNRNRNFLQERNRNRNLITDLTGPVINYGTGYKIVYLISFI
jgi:hypothetical protein